MHHPERTLPKYISIPSLGISRVQSTGVLLVSQSGPPHDGVRCAWGLDGKSGQASVDDQVGEPFDKPPLLHVKLRGNRELYGRTTPHIHLGEEKGYLHCTGIDLDELKVIGQWLSDQSTFIHQFRGHYIPRCPPSMFCDESYVGIRINQTKHNKVKYRCCFRKQHLRKGAFTHPKQGRLFKMVFDFQDSSYEAAFFKTTV